MIQPKPETVVPMLAMSAWKHELLVKAQRTILHAALSAYPHPFGPGDETDLPEMAGHEQGVVSNAWNALRCAEIIERVSITYSEPSRAIHGGRRRNPDPKDKGRWTAMYRLRSRPLALEWLKRHGFETKEPVETKQEDLPLGRTPMEVFAED